MRKFVQKVTKRCLQLTKIESPPIECYLPNIHEMTPFILKKFVIDNHTPSYIYK